MTNRTLGQTWSVCESCGRQVPAKTSAINGDVFLTKFCPDHGQTTAFIRSDAEDYVRTLRVVKPALVPKAHHGNADVSCPDGCGFCSRHEQHLCMPIIEITNRCNLACPICINDSGQSGSDIEDMSPGDFKHLLDNLLEAEQQIDVLNLSGGEPLLHPQFWKIAEEALSRKNIIRLSVSTNGIALLNNPELVRRVKQNDMVISLQFDGFDDSTYRHLRGENLWDTKQKILETLSEHDIPTTLTMTAAAGVNENAFRPMLDLLFSSHNILSLMIQPLNFTGRAKHPASERQKSQRLTIPDIRRLLDEAGHPSVKGEDLLPLPCSHPLCFSLAFFLITDDGIPVSLTRLNDPDKLLDYFANRVIFGLDSDENDILQEEIYRLWSGPKGSIPNSESVLKTLRNLLRNMNGCNCNGFDPRQVFRNMEQHVKSIFIHAFQDRQTFDLARVRRCCQAYARADGTLIPACVRNTQNV